MIKHTVKQDRLKHKFLKCLIIMIHAKSTLENIGRGYGFPSSHSQYIGYLLCGILDMLYVLQAPLHGYRFPKTR